MSQQNSPRDSISDSSGSSPNAVYMLRSDKETSDLILFGQLVAKHQRSATVRRASSASLRNKQDSFAKSQDDITIPVNPPPERGYRRSLDSTYRQSLESISEYKPKNFVSSTSLGPTPYRDNLESTCSDCTDYATRSATIERDGHDNRTFQSPSSASYLSWIESVNAATISATTATPSKHPAGSSTLDEKNLDVDSKVGEWNNFWLNYNNPHTRYMTSPHVGNSTTCDDRTGDDVSDCKSTCSTQREFNEKLAGEQVVLTFDEVQEALNCAQRVVDILQKAIKRSDNDVEMFIERGRHDSYISTHTISVNDESFRDRYFSFDTQSTPRPSLKPQPTTQQPQPTSNSCINALLNTGVADILKRVINKRREVLTSDEGQSTARSSFSEWSSSGK